MNPDGVENGFWRYNYNKKDLNRDWDNFFQPETNSVKNFLDNLKNRNQPILYIDFHSTYKNIFYISDAQLTNSHPNFLLNWLEKSRLELSKIGYNFSIKESYTKSNKISKNYFHNKYNIPSMTYEVSDTEERSKITKSSKILARNLITILLDPEIYTIYRSAIVPTLFTDKSSTPKVRANSEKVKSVPSVPLVTLPPRL